MNNILATALLSALPFIAHAEPYRIDHMDPPLWWTGMHNSTLQLMVHGPQLADLEPVLAYPGVRIAAVSRVANRNYLFIDLEIAADAVPGKLDLAFQRGGEAVAAVHYSYQLLARAKDSARRVGF